jgi:hypothetical protein
LGIEHLRSAYYRSPPTTSSYEQLALQKAKGKVGNADLELGETLGEYRETIQMLRQPLSGLKKFLLDDKSRNLRLLLALARRDKSGVNRLLGRTGKASADAMASTWLELRYGLRPLVMLVQDVIDEVEKKRLEFDGTKIRSAKSKMSFTEFNRYDSTEDIGPYVAYVQARTLVEDEIVVTASIQYRQSEEGSLTDRLGLTPRFLPETAWNLTRLSFVVDWLFSIGPWLASLRVNPNVEILGNTVGVKVFRRITCTPIQWYKGTVTWQPAKGACKFYRTSYRRKTNVDVSYLPHFTFGRVIDLYKVIDSIGLIWQLALSNRRK